MFLRVLIALRVSNRTSGSRTATTVLLAYGGSH